MRGCGFSNATEECSVNSYGGRFKSCYKTCNTPLCNYESMEETFPSFSLNCVHCSSTVQPWCMENDLKEHLDDPGVNKKCWNGKCLTTKTGRYILMNFNHWLFNRDMNFIIVSPNKRKNNFAHFQKLMVQSISFEHVVTRITKMTNA